jgi:hypothetical protein
MQLYFIVAGIVIPRTILGLTINRTNNTVKTSVIFTGPFGFPPYTPPTAFTASLNAEVAFTVFDLLNGLQLGC